MNLELLRAQLVRHEGMKLKPYRDSVDKFTIGCGRNLDDVGISESEAMVLLENDIIRVFDDLDRALPWWRNMDEMRQRVIVDMCFNMGLTRLLGFKKALSAMQAGNYAAAAMEMLDSKWATQVKGRANTLAEMMKEG